MWGVGGADSYRLLKISWRLGLVFLDLLKFPIQGVRQNSRVITSKSPSLDVCSTPTLSLEATCRLSCMLVADPVRQSHHEHRSVSGRVEVHVNFFGTSNGVDARLPSPT